MPGVDGCPAGVSGGSGELLLNTADTAKLSLGWHTLKIDYLGDSKYAPAEFTAPFFVAARAPTLLATKFPTPKPTFVPSPAAVRASTPTGSPRT